MADPRQPTDRDASRGLPARAWPKILVILALAMAMPAGAEPDGWLTLFGETGYAAMNRERDDVKEEASGVALGLGLRVVQRLGWLAAQGEARGVYDFGLQGSGKDNLGALVGRVGIGPRLGSGSITVGLAWDSLLREPVRPVVSWTILDVDANGDDRYRELFFGITDQGIAAGGTREFIWEEGGAFSVGCLFFGGDKDNGNGGAGVLITVSFGVGSIEGL